MVTQWGPSAPHSSPSPLFSACLFIIAKWLPISASWALVIFNFERMRYWDASDFCFFFCHSAGFLKLYGSTFVKVVDFSLVRGQLIRYWGNTPKMGVLISCYFALMIRAETTKYIFDVILLSSSCCIRVQKLVLVKWPSILTDMWNIPVDFVHLSNGWAYQVDF